jgi:hypothetical protein
MPPAPALLLGILIRVCLSAGALLPDTPAGDTCGTAAIQTIPPQHETVTVAAESTPPREPGVSSEMRVGTTTLQSLRSVIADDPVRSAQALPGAVSGDDFQAQFSVRGASLRHLGLVVDGTPVPELFHGVYAVENTGSVAMLNRDALDGMALTAGPHGRRHGDWLGATLEFAAREGSRNRTTARAAVSGTGASVVTEGPLDRARRGSWLVGVRRSYLGWLVSKLEPNFESTIGNADGHLKMAYDVTARQRVEVLVIGGDSTYRARTASAANGLLRATSGSTLASAYWAYTRPRWYVGQRLSFVGSEFRNTGVHDQELARGYSQAVLWRTHANAMLGTFWTVAGGGQGEHRRLNQTLRRFRLIRSREVEPTAERNHSAEAALGAGWAELTRRTNNGAIVLGLRAGGREGSGPAVSPWLLVERRVGPNLTLRASAGEAAQYPDLSFVRAGGGAFGPERTRAVEASLEHRLTRSVHWRVSVFGRNDTDLLRRTGEVRLDASGEIMNAERAFPLFEPSLEGSSRGIDVIVSRAPSVGLYGWVGYTWARTRMHDTTSGESFDADQDQRHTLNVVAIQPLSGRAEISATLRVGSNFPLVGYFAETTEGLRLAAERNLVRLPLYSRLDVRFTRTFAIHDRRLTLVLEVLNLTGRRNVGQADGSIRDTLEVVGYAERMVPFVPSAGLVVAF